MKIEIFKRDKENPIYQKAIPFINRLLQVGIPLSAIDTNDFNSNTNPSVYITREYGRIKGGAFRKYRQWNERNVENALNFYKAENPKKQHGFIS